ncbi:hypothetical protein D3C71_1985960 [compost metagenome]
MDFELRSDTGSVRQSADDETQTASSQGRGAGASGTNGDGHRKLGESGACSFTFTSVANSSSK